MPKADVLAGEKFASWKEKKLEEMTDRDWRIFREDNDIVVRGGKVPYPIRNWSEAGTVGPDILHNLSKLKYKAPKPIQMQTLPIGLLKKDMIGLAPTGEGKTLAYLIPALEFIRLLERITPMTVSYTHLTLPTTPYV